MRSMLLASAALLCAAPSFAQEISPQESQAAIGAPEYSPYLHQANPRQVYWGDTHLHTSFSTDAGMIGNRLGPDDALRFAKGEMIVASFGERARLVRPLDFLVIADHAENLGLALLIEESNADLLRIPFGREVHDLVKAGDPWGAYARWGEEGIATGTDLLPNPKLVGSMWDRIVDDVDRHNEPGVFTAFHGFEWTSSPDARNLHRVVVFRDGAEEARQVIPFSTFDSTDPEDLWDYLERYEELTGGQALAIPHNGNLSNGLMFAVERINGAPIDADYAARRMRWEPLYEVTQIKGDGEAHPFLSPNDEFADYYNWDKGDFGFNAKTPEMLEFEYARSALKVGLEQQSLLGVNPFKFGMVGATDSHTSLATTREENYFGKFSGVEPGTEEERYEDVVVTDRRAGSDGSITIRHWESLASGLQGVWARENTREALWDAMARKETYATTGTRISVRVFGGWDFEPADVHLPDFGDQGYIRGVPMGGDLIAAADGAAPRFVIRALRDPDGANLDRVQIVKAWLDGNGDAQERIFEVAWAGDRAVDADGKLDPIGSTVDVENATYTNDIGRAYLAGHWEDPDFDPAQPAFYYVRVLEIPTPTWLAYDRVRLGADVPEEGLLIHQERAYTSPIWYTPG